MFRVHFFLVEHIGVLIRHITWSKVKLNHNIQTAIVYAFSNFIECLVDISPAISKCTFMYLDMIPQDSLKVCTLFSLTCVICKSCIFRI